MQTRFIEQKIKEITGFHSMGSSFVPAISPSERKFLQRNERIHGFIGTVQTTPCSKNGN